MGLLDSILGAAGGQTNAVGGESPLMGMIGSLLAQCGGLQGLANQFMQSGHGDTFSSWVSTGQNKPISGDQIQSVLGSQQVQALAAKIGVDPSQASQLLAQFLPKVIDGLTPNGQVDPSANHQQSLASLLPSLLQSFGGEKSINV
jgi:uncharacterized protein YidB (DUF937 family)